MNLRQLEIFNEVSKVENVSKAAENFLLPPSAVSTMIKRLEEEIGVNLLNRTSNKVSLTNEGRMLANELTAILPILKNSFEKISGSKETKKIIRILIRTRPKWVGEMVESFLRVNSSVQFSIEKDYKTKDFDNFDIVISYQIPELSKWNNFLLSTEVACIKAHKDSPLIGAELNFEEVASMPFILHGNDNGRIIYETACAKAGIKPNVLIEVNDSLLLESFVKSGLGLTIGVRKSVNDKYSSDMVPLKVKNFTNYYENTFVYFKNDKNNPSVSTFCDYLYKNRSIT